MNTIMDNLLSCGRCDKTIRLLNYANAAGQIAVEAESTAPEDLYFDPKRHVPHRARCANDKPKETMEMPLVKKPCNCGDGEKKFKVMYPNLRPLTQPMKIYLSSRYGRRAELLRYASDLIVGGYECTSSWLTIHNREKNDELPTPEMQRVWAREDLDDVAASDLMICFTEKPEAKASRGGRHVEFGCAIAMGMPVICIGPSENIFYGLPQVQHAGNWFEAVKILVQLRKADIQKRVDQLPAVDANA